MDMIWLCLKVGNTTQWMAISWKGETIGFEDYPKLSSKLPLVALNRGISKAKIGSLICTTDDIANILETIMGSNWIDS